MELAAEIEALKAQLAEVVGVRARRRQSAARSRSPDPFRSATRRPSQGVVVVPAWTSYTHVRGRAASWRPLFRSIEGAPAATEKADPLSRAGVLRAVVGAPQLVTR